MKVIHAVVSDEASEKFEQYQKKNKLPNRDTALDDILKSIEVNKWKK